MSRKFQVGFGKHLGPLLILLENDIPKKISRCLMYTENLIILFTVRDLINLQRDLEIWVLEWLYRCNRSHISAII